MEFLIHYIPNVQLASFVWRAAVEPQVARYPLGQS